MFISLALTSSKNTEVWWCEDLSWADLVQVSPVRTWWGNDRTEIEDSLYTVKLDVLKHMVMGLQKFLEHHRRRYHNGRYEEEHTWEVHCSEPRMSRIGVGQYLTTTNWVANMWSHYLGWLESCIPYQSTRLKFFLSVQMNWMIHLCKNVETPSRGFGDDSRSRSKSRTPQTC